jgi:phosphoribosyl 1,2-cyclic phosphodiesterase
VIVSFLGVRGSTPAPGAEFARTGGNTSCIAIAHEGEPPRLVLDAGTGLRRLGRRLDGDPFHGTILLSHLHWDHLQGLPFFAAGDRDDADARLVIPAQGDPLDVLRRAMSPPHFPIGPEGLRGRWRFEGAEAGHHEIEGFGVDLADVAHKGGRTFGIRVSDGVCSLAYLPDHATVDGSDVLDRPEVRALVDDVDVLIHDAQFVEGEEGVAADYGHALVSDAVRLADAARVRELWLFHHAPDRTDAEVDAIEAAVRHRPGGACEVRMATEQSSLCLGQGASRDAEPATGG